MGRYDNIDIFFIALISAYFITLFCIIISLIIIKTKSIVKVKRVNKETTATITKTIEVEPVKEEKKKNKDKTKFRLTDSAIIKKLFMTKISKEEMTQKENILKKDKIRVLLTTRIKPEAKIEEKDFKAKKEQTNATIKVLEKKEEHNNIAKEVKSSVPKSRTKKTPNQDLKINTSKKKVASKTASKNGTKKSPNSKSNNYTKGNNTKKRTTSNQNKNKNSNRTKKSTSTIKQKNPTKASTKKTVKK